MSWLLEKPGVGKGSGCQPVRGYFHGGGCWKCSKINCDDGYTTQNLLKKHIIGQHVNYISIKLSD